MPLYETVFIARQDISVKAAEDLAKAFTKIVNDNGGEVKKTESWGLRNLAYRIKKNKKGHYTLIHSSAPPAAITEMERNMRLNEDVLRYMTVSIDKIPDGPSPVLKQDEEREERDGGFGGGYGGGFSREPREGGYRGDREPREPREPREHKERAE